MGTAPAWNARYAEGSDGWTLDDTPPVIAKILAGELLELPQADLQPPRRVLVPGAGRGHDAVGWARAGHEVVAVDWAQLAVDAMRARIDGGAPAFEVRRADVLDLPEDLHASFDFVWEQTCLCALYPERHEAYVESMWRALRPGGELVALLWNHGQPDGPPFDMAPSLVEDLFAPRFTMGPPVSIGSLGRREGEWVVRLQRRPE